MGQQIVLDQTADADVLLAGDLTLEETAAMLDSLFEIKGIKFEFHKTFKLKPKQTSDFYENMIQAGRKYLSPLVKIPAEQLRIVEVPDMYAPRHSNQEVSYSPGKMTGEELVKNGFTQAYARLKQLVLKDGNSPAIISFETTPHYSSGIYRCKFINLTESINHRGSQSNHQVFNKYRPRLAKILETKLVEPEFESTID